MKSPVFEVSIKGMHSVKIPKKIATPFIKNGHKRVKVVAKFENASVGIYAALKKSKLGDYSIMFSKNNQKILGLFPNDYFHLQFFEDTSKYGVEMPEELNAVLASDPEAHQIFESLIDGKKRGIIYMILPYKNAQARIDKALLLCENLKRGIRDSKVLLKAF